MKPLNDVAAAACSIWIIKVSLNYKTRLVKDNLKRIGKLENVIVHDTIGMKEPVNYRNKAQFPVASGNGTVITGFYAKRTHEVIDSAECGIQDKVKRQDK